MPSTCYPSSATSHDVSIPTNASDWTVLFDAVTVDDVTVLNNVSFGTLTQGTPGELEVDTFAIQAGSTEVVVCIEGAAIITRDSQ